MNFSALLRFYQVIQSENDDSLLEFAVKRHTEMCWSQAKRFGNGWLSVILDGNLYVGVPEHDRDSWLILKFGRVEGAGIICDYTSAGDFVTVGH